MAQVVSGAPAQSPARPAAREETQQHPIKLYLVVWAWLFVLSLCSYLVDYFHIQGILRWSLICLFMMLKAGLIVAVFMHMAWERLTLVYAILVPPTLILGDLVRLECAGISVAQHHIGRASSILVTEAHHLPFQPDLTDGNSVGDLVVADVVGLKLPSVDVPHHQSVSPGTLLILPNPAICQSVPTLPMDAALAT